MKYVSTADLKSKLSHYLGRVKEGEAIYVTSHGKPVAELVPVVERETLTIIPPTRPLSDLSKIEGVHIPNIDVVELLREDRDKR